MFSTRNSALVSHTDGIFTHYSASTNRTHGNVQSDLITFLSIVQKYNVDYLPITWQPALTALGVGGSGTINQSTFIGDMPLAFKRFHDDSDFLPLISEVLILNQPPIQSHPNIINLEGICWEIKPRTEKAVPVLVFEKAAWDLKQFMGVHEGMNMSIVDRLKICADIGSAIIALHAYDVIHGDIKPQNVLVCKDSTGKTTIKVADFGYSTLAGGEVKVLLPKSRPWNAPEHHFGEFDVPEAKKTDVYSFGMLCLWVLFGTMRTPQNTTQCKFEESTGPRTLLEELKADDKMVHIANQHIDSVPLAELDDEHRICLKEFFNLTVRYNPKERLSDIEKLASLFGQERIQLQPIIAEPLQTTRELSMHTNFRMSEHLVYLMRADYRVRIQLRDCLEKCYDRNQNQPCAAHIAFQIAFCYRIGFGTKSDTDKCQIWLERSNKPNDLNIEKEAVRPASGKSEGKKELRGFVSVDLVEEYRAWGLPKLQEARKYYEREIGDMAREFGELHFILIALYEIFGYLLDELGEFRTSEQLRMRITNETEKKCGIDHPSTLISMDNLALTYKNQGRWKEAEELEVQVLEARKRLLGRHHSDTLHSMGNIAFTFWNQGRMKEAEELNVQVMETRKRVLTQEHPDTLNTMCNLAATFSNQGQWNKAEEQFVRVVEMRKRVLGQEHPLTLASMSNLASTYRNQGQLKKAEVLEVQVMTTRKRVLGQEHPDTLSSLGNLASTYSNQGRWVEAKELEAQVMAMRKRVLGQEHPDTLTSMCNLAVTYSQLGQWEEAEELELQVTETFKRVLSQDHPNTLTSMNNLAATYSNLERWKEAEELFVQVMETRKRVLGHDHPDTLTSMCNLASTFSNQKRWKEAEELFGLVMEMEKSVLGQEHPSTLTSMGNLAWTYIMQGRWKDAEEANVQVVEIRKRVLGEEHPDTLMSMNNLASNYRNQGRWEEAEDLQIQVATIIRTTLGENHPSTVIAMDNLASLRKKRELSSVGNRLEHRFRKVAEGLSNHLEEGLLPGSIFTTLENSIDDEERLPRSDDVERK